LSIEPPKTVTRIYSRPHSGSLWTQ
jgi:hypothetical protein